MKQSELQSLQTILKQELTHDYSVLEYLKLQRSMLWNLSDKNNPETEEAFHVLNQTKNDIRFLKQRIAKKAEIAFNIKKELRTHRQMKLQVK